MTHPLLICTSAILVSLLTGCTTSPKQQPSAAIASKPDAVDLGNFSVSLLVKDLKVSREFYEKLGFRVVAGNGRTYSILQNPTATIGLYQGMIEKNMLTFNPGWDRSCAALPEFVDIRELQRSFKERGLTPALAADESSTGAASMILVDPDGNPILFDQFVPRTAR